MTERWGQFFTTQRGQSRMSFDNLQALRSHMAEAEIGEA